MSQTRQIRTLALGLPSGRRVEGHVHPWDQLVHATSGVLTVVTEQGTWVVPTHRAVWVPGSVEHELKASGFVALRTLYFPPGLARGLPRECCVLDVSSLLRELILHCIEVGVLDGTEEVHGHLIAVLLDRLQHVPVMPLHLPWPQDARARRVAAAIQEHFGENIPLEAFCDRSGASKRTIERLFTQETRMTLGQWRAQVRLLHALPRLAAGEPVTNVALDVGYESTSAFIVRFKKALGTTPGQYHLDEGRASRGNP